MPAQIWIVSGTTMVAAVAMGVGLGNFAISPQNSAATRSPAIEQDYANDAGAALSVTAQAESALVGPQAIHCTGCGPTLADRQYGADQAELDADGMIGGTHDLVVREYMDQPDYPPSYDPPLPRSQFHRLPDRVNRFADGDDAQSDIGVPTQTAALDQTATDNYQ